MRAPAERLHRHMGKHSRECTRAEKGSARSVVRTTFHTNPNAAHSVNAFARIQPRILEVGCGVSLLSERLSREPGVASVTGIDYSPAAVKLMQERKPERGNGRLDYKVSGLCVHAACCYARLL